MHLLTNADQNRVKLGGDHLRSEQFTGGSRPPTGSAAEIHDLPGVTDVIAQLISHDCQGCGSFWHEPEHVDVPSPRPTNCQSVPPSRMRISVSTWGSAPHPD